MFEQLAPWLGRRVLEIGSGIGSFTRYLVGRDLVVATDLNPRYLQILANTFERHTRVEVTSLDLMDFDPAPVAARGIDTILCLNVLEHVEDDLGALRRLHAALVPGGRLLLLVPAHEWLYGAIDRAIDHHRRYGRAGLAARLREAGFEVEHTAFFNRLGVVGWYLNSVVLRRTRVPGLQVHLQNALVPLLRAESALRLPFGLSLIAVARRL
jgi:SAM-dependent methyltransferase